MNITSFVTVLCNSKNNQKYILDCQVIRVLYCNDVKLITVQISLKNGMKVSHRNELNRMTLTESWK